MTQTTFSTHTRDHALLSIRKLWFLYAGDAVGKLSQNVENEI